MHHIIKSDRIIFYIYVVLILNSHNLNWYNKAEPLPSILFELNLSSANIMSDHRVISCGKNSSYSWQKHHKKKIIINDGGFIISVMDVPMQNTEAEEDGISDRHNDLQGSSNSITIVNPVETVLPDPEAVETP